MKIYDACMELMVWMGNERGVEWSGLWFIDEKKV